MPKDRQIALTKPEIPIEEIDRIIAPSVRAILSSLTNVSEKIAQSFALGSSENALGSTSLNN